jgi:hypothetical protein
MVREESMKYLRISENSTSRELESIARAIHLVVRLPVVVTSLNRNGR